MANSISFTQVNFSEVAGYRNQANSIYTDAVEAFSKSGMACVQVNFAEPVSVGGSTANLRAAIEKKNLSGVLKVMQRGERVYLYNLELIPKA